MNHTPERALVGDIIDDPRLIVNVRRIVPSGEMFSDPSAGKFYDVVLSTYDENGGIDLAVLNPKLSKIGVKPSEVVEYTALASSVMAENHARIVAEGHMTRVTVQALAQVQKDLVSGGDVADAISTTTALLSNLKKTFEQEKTVHISHVVQEAFDELDDIFSGRKSMGLPFGFADLDKHTGGMDNGDLVVIAAPEKSGKSTMMIQVVFHNAQKGTPCLIFSSEMMRKQLVYRKALMDTRVRWIDVKNNQCLEPDKKKLIQRLHELAALPVFVRHGVFNILDIMGDVEKYVKERNVRLVAVDYIQRVVPVSKKSNENREREVASISSGLKNVALEYGIPVLALSQVNDDLRARESRAIEQDMDKMITIDNKPDVPEGATGALTNIRLRQRMGLSGNMGDLQLYYDLAHGVWYNASGLQPSQMPF